MWLQSEGFTLSEWIIYMSSIGNPLVKPGGWWWWWAEENGWRPGCDEEWTLGGLLAVLSEIMLRWFGFPWPVKMRRVVLRRAQDGLSLEWGRSDCSDVMPTTAYPWSIRVFGGSVHVCAGVCSALSTLVASNWTLHVCTLIQCCKTTSLQRGVNIFHRLCNITSI